jgi:hypothetical protein
MKLRALRNFYFSDKKRGSFTALKVGDNFEIDEVADGPEIFMLLQAGRATVDDDRFVKEGADYYCVVACSLPLPEGGFKNLRAGDYASLLVEIAVRLMLTGHVRPADEFGWQPRHLLGGNLNPVGEPKRMFDDGEAPKVSWMERARRRD